MPKNIEDHTKFEANPATITGLVNKKFFDPIARAASIGKVIGMAQLTDLR